MGQFKPMVKMETTEPSVILKLKKGGHVDMKKSAKAEEGHKPMHKYDGGAMGMRGLPMVGGSAAPVAAMSPKRPSPMDRKKMMMAQMMKQKMAAPQMAAPQMAAPMMKEGGKADMAQDKAMIKKAISQHDAQEHKGGKGTKLSLKNGGSTGGVKMGNAGGYKTGGVVKGKAGGYKTGGVVLGKAGGFKKGGAAKKAYATGGLVNTGKPVAMPEGKKKPTPPVAISQLSGTFKKGGSVKKLNGGGDLQSDKETKGYKGTYSTQKADNLADVEALNPMPYIRPILDKVKGLFGSTPGAVTKTKESTTVVPKQRKGGKVNC